MIYYEIYTLEKRLGQPLYAISYTVYINSTVSSNIKKKTTVHTYFDRRGSHISMVISSTSPALTISNVIFISRRSFNFSLFLRRFQWLKEREKVRAIIISYLFTQKCHILALSARCGKNCLENPSASWKTIPTILTTPHLLRSSKTLTLHLTLTKTMVVGWKDTSWHLRLGTTLSTCLGHRAANCGWAAQKVNKTWQKWFRWIRQLVTTSGTSTCFPYTQSKEL